MPKIDIDAAPRGDGTTYPDEFAGPCLSRRRWKLGDAAGLTQFGVNLLRLPDGADGGRPQLLRAVRRARRARAAATAAAPIWSAGHHTPGTGRRVRRVGRAEKNEARLAVRMRGCW